MRITWRGLELPTSIQKDNQIEDANYGRFFIEPFERGFGTTIGNSLRRVLLSSLEGSAVTSVKIDGVDHEFTTIDGIKEDVTEILLNVKRLILRKKSDEPKTLFVSATNAGKITAGQIESDASVEIINKDLVIATLTEDVEFNMELTVETGRGYSPAAERIIESERFDQEIGRIIVDAIYSPVLRVRYKTEDTRVGQKTNFDKLVLEIWTNGTVTPDMALVEAAKILRKHINPFVQYFEMSQETVEEEMAPEKGEEKSGVDEELASKLNTPVQDMELSVRANNCLESINVNTVGDLIKMHESDLLKVRSFGKTCLREIKRKLSDMGLSLGMTDIEV